MAAKSQIADGLGEPDSAFISWSHCCNEEGKPRPHWPQLTDCFSGQEQKEAFEAIESQFSGQYESKPFEAEDAFKEYIWNSGGELFDYKIVHCGLKEDIEKEDTEIHLRQRGCLVPLIPIKTYRSDAEWTKGFCKRCEEVKTLVTGSKLSEEVKSVSKKLGGKSLINFISNPSEDVRNNWPDSGQTLCIQVLLVKNAESHKTRSQRKGT